jgi:hypothetical protein
MKYMDVEYIYLNVEGMQMLNFLLKHFAQWQRVMKW